MPVAAPGPSSLHSNVEPESVAVNLYDGEFTFVGPDGPPLICVSGVFGPGGLGSGASPRKRASTKSPPDVVPTTTSLPSACTTPSTLTSSAAGSPAAAVCLPSSAKVASSVPSVLRRATANAPPAFPNATALPLLSNARP